MAHGYSRLSKIDLIENRQQGKVALQQVSQIMKLIDQTIPYHNKHTRSTVVSVCSPAEKGGIKYSGNASMRIG